MQTITAIAHTYLKKKPLQVGQLPKEQLHGVRKGKNYKVLDVQDFDARIPAAGHFRVKLAYGGGDWYIFGGHWKLPWQEVVNGDTQPEWDEVDWKNPKARVSRHFTVREVTLGRSSRTPDSNEVKQNIIAVARDLDEIRVWWGGPISCNSWYRPWPENTAIGSRSPNHPGGYAVDFRPTRGSIWRMQKRFENEWYNTGKWEGGFGRGAKKGFIHIDRRNWGRPRRWNY